MMTLQVLLLALVSVIALADTDGASSAVCIAPDEHAAVVTEMESIAATLKTKQTQFAEVEADWMAKLDRSSQDLGATKKEHSSCVENSELLVNKIKDREALIKSMDESNKKSEAEGLECRKQIVSAEKTAEMLSQCQKKVDALGAVETDNDSCKLSLKSVKDELANKEKSFVEDLKVLRQMLEKGEAQRKSAVAQSEDRSKQLSELQLEMRKTRALADEANESKLVFSVAQLQANLQKLVVVSSALSRFTCDKVHAAIPPAVFNAITLYKAQAKVAVWNVYEKLRPHVEIVSSHVSTGHAAVRRLYAERAAPHVDSVLKSADLKKRATAACAIVSTNTNRYITIGNAWIDKELLAPLIKEYPQVASHIPSAPIDRLAALGYAIFITYIASRVIRLIFLYGLKPTCRVVWWTVTLPVTIPMCVCRRVCCGKKSCGKKNKPVVKSEVEDSTKTKKNSSQPAKPSANASAKNKKN